MKKLMVLGCLGVIAASLTGCKSTTDDRWRADLDVSLESAHFKPVYEVMTEKGIVKGSATSSFSWWGFVGDGPDVYANELGGPITFKVGVKEAAFADACKKANCQILLAPRFTITKTKGILGFSGEEQAVVEGIPAVLKTAEEIPLEKWIELKSKLK